MHRPCSLTFQLQEISYVYGRIDKNKKGCRMRCDLSPLQLVVSISSPFYSKVKSLNLTHALPIILYLKKKKNPLPYVCLCEIKLVSSHLSNLMKFMGFIKQTKLLFLILKKVQIIISKVYMIVIERDNYMPPELNSMKNWSTWIDEDHIHYTQVNSYVWLIRILLTCAKIFFLLLLQCQLVRRSYKKKCE